MDTKYKSVLKRVQSVTPSVEYDSLFSASDGGVRVRFYGFGQRFNIYYSLVGGFLTPANVSLSTRRFDDFIKGSIKTVQKYEQ